MFYGCYGLVNLNVSSFDTSKVTNMDSMFSYSNVLVTIYTTDFSTSAVTSSTNMFEGCQSLVGGNVTTFNSSYIDATYARIDNAETPGYFTQK